MQNRLRYGHRCWKKTKVTQKDAKIGAFRIQSPSTINCCFSGNCTLVGFTVARLTSAQEQLEGNFEIRKMLKSHLCVLFGRGVRTPVRGVGTPLGFVPTLVRLTSGQENRGGMLDAVRFTADALGVHFIKENLQNPSNIHSKKTFKHRSRKNIPSDTNRISKWYQHRCNQSSTLNAQAGIENDYELYLKQMFSHGEKY